MAWEIKLTKNIINELTTKGYCTYPKTSFFSNEPDYLVPMIDYLRDGEKCCYRLVYDTTVSATGIKEGELDEYLAMVDKRVGFDNIEVYDTPTKHYYKLFDTNILNTRFEFYNKAIKKGYSDEQIQAHCFGKNHIAI